MTGETEAERMLRAQREWQTKKPAGILQAVPIATGAAPPPSPPATKSANLFAKIAGVAIGIALVGAFLALLIKNPAVPECKASKPSLFGTEILYNSCDFGVVAKVCREYLLGQSGGACNPSKYYAPGEDYILMAGDDASLFMGTITPFKAIVYVCRPGYEPVVSSPSAGRYECEKVSP